MTKRSRASQARRIRKLPPARDVAAFYLDQENQRFVVTTKTMLINQLHRDGPRIRRSFDELAKEHIRACSELFGQTHGMLMRHLPRQDEQDLKATAARLLASASSTYIASIEVARHGYRRQYGILARTLVETLATVIVLMIQPTALEKFYKGELSSVKCVGWAKAALPPIGSYYGMLSEQFTHVGTTHAILEPTKAYKPDDEAFPFIISSMRGDAWLLFVVTELVYHDELLSPRYWFRQTDEHVAYNPSEEEREWMATFLESQDIVL